MPTHMRSSKDNGNRIFRPGLSTFFILCLLLTCTFAHAETYISSNISTDTVWTKEQGPYIIIGDISIYNTQPNGATATLTIEPGTRIEFETNADLTIGYTYNASTTYYGALNAEGSETEPIVFTSRQAVPAPGDWQGIIINEGFDETRTRISHCHITYATSGIRVNLGTPAISDNLFENNSQSAIYANSNCTTNITGSRGSGNGKNVIEVNGTIQQDTTWRKQDLPIYVPGDLSVYHANANSDTATLTIEPGTHIEFNTNADLTIGYSYTASTTYYGALNAEGSQDEPIVFTSHQAEPAPGNWQGIIINKGFDETRTRIRHCNITYATSGIRVNSGTPAISDNLLENNSLSAIYAKSTGTANITGNRGTGNGKNVIEVSGTIQQDTTWRKQDLPIYVPGDLSVYHANANSETATLTIEPGTRIEFNTNADLRIGNSYNSSIYYGALNAEGSETEPIVFTSHQAEPAPGDWQGIHFNQGTRMDSLMSNCIIEYTSRNIYINNAGPEIRNCTFRHGSGYGVQIQEGSPTISDNIFLNNSLSAMYSVPDGLSQVTGNQGAGNGHDAIEVSGRIDTNAIWRNQALPFYVSNDIDIYNITPNSDTVTLTIEPGTRIEFNTYADLTIGNSYNSYIYYGALNAQGTETAPIVFTSHQAEPAPGDWSGLYFQKGAHSDSLMNHCIVEYASGRNLNIDNASPQVRNSTFRNSSGYGIRIYTGQPAVADNFFSGNAYSAITATPDCLSQVTGNQGAGNGHDAIEVSGRIDTNTTWRNQALPFYVSNDVYVYHTDANGGTTTLTIEPGTHIEFSTYADLTIGYSYYSSIYYGALNAQGTETAPIVFTSHQAEPAPGDWSGLYFQKGTHSDSLMSHCIVEYASGRNLYINNASPQIKNSTFRNSSGTGLHIYSGQPTITDSFFSDNAASAISATPDCLSRVTGSQGTGNGQDAIEVSGRIDMDSVWRNQALPFYVSNDVDIYHTAANGDTTTLTIEPGTRIEFNTNADLRIGYSYNSNNYYGALNAQGTGAAPIVFTSHQATPAPGNWPGIDIGSAGGAGTILTYCTVEYGSQNIYIGDASPVIQNSAIRAASQYGIYLYGAGSNNAQITCNNIVDMPTAIVVYSATPLIENNNILNYQNAAIVNNTADIVTAENNYWGENKDPGANPGAFSAYVDAVPWLSEPSSCMAEPPPNRPPFAPASPAPSDNAVRVGYESVSFSWSGTDPNPYDTLSFDLYFGEDEALLAPIALNLESRTFTHEGLQPGTRYFWQVIARDDQGLETSGPVWQFITEGLPSDLIVTGISWDPADNIHPGDEVSFSVDIQNIGQGPVVDSFYIRLSIDGSAILNARVTDPILPQDSISLSAVWQAKAGTHTIEALADNYSSVAESDETNNSATGTIADIPDETPPGVYFLTGPATDGITCGSDLNICWSGTDNITPSESLEYQYQVDEDAWSGWSGDTCYTGSGMSEGSHTFRVTARDLEGNVSASPLTLQFTANISPLAISNVSASQAATTATISWLTSQAASSRVEYGPDADYGLMTPTYNYNATRHSITLSGLSPETDYHFRVISGNECQETASSDIIFRTDPLPPPNLAVTSMTVTPAIFASDALPVRWIVQNSGGDTAQASWTDNIFISQDDTLSGDDTLLGAAPRTEDLAAHAAYEAELSVQIPDLPVGLYYILIRTDAEDTVSESHETDNQRLQAVNITDPLSLVVTPQAVSLVLTPVSAQTRTFTFTITNLGKTALTGVTAQFDGLPENVEFQAGVPASLAVQEPAEFSCTITARDDSVPASEPVLRITSDQGAATAVQFKINVLPASHDLITSPEDIATTMLRGRQTVFEFDVINAGGAAATDMVVLIPEAPWMHLSSPKIIEAIEPEEASRVSLMLDPDETLELGPYTGEIILSGDDVQLSIPFSFTAVSEAKGDLKVISTDEFTYFAEDKPNLAGAAVKLSDPRSGTVIAQGTTDETGIFLATDIPEGKYFLTMTAANHTEFKDLVDIRPGMENEFKGFLSRQMVRYSWNVEPVEIDDNYMITLEAEFETHVPAPVVTIEPPTQVAPYFAGESAVVEVKVTNHGLISAYETGLNFLYSSKYYVKPLISDIGELPPMSSVIVPVIIRDRAYGPIPDSELTGLTAADSTSGTTKPDADLGELTAKGAVRDFMDDLCPDIQSVQGYVSYVYYCAGGVWKRAKVVITPQMLEAGSAIELLCETLNAQSATDLSCACTILEAYFSRKDPRSWPWVPLVRCLACIQPAMPDFDTVEYDDPPAPSGYVDNDQCHGNCWHDHLRRRRHHRYRPRIHKPRPFEWTSGKRCDPADLPEADLPKSVILKKTAPLDASDIEKYGGKIIRYNGKGGQN